MRKSLILIALISFIVEGCTAGLNKDRPQDPLKLAIEYYKEGKYQKVLDVLRDRISSYIYTSKGDDAEYYLAMSYFKLKDYEDAILEFEFLINNYNQSPFREKAYYFLALSYFKNSPRIERDQSDLKKALSIISDFEAEYPTSPLGDTVAELKKEIINKLSLKMADIVKTYYNLEKYTSALLYINLIRKEYPGTQGENLSYLFEALIKKEEGLDFKDSISRFNPESIPKNYKKYYKKLLYSE